MFWCYMQGILKNTFPTLALSWFHEAVLYLKAEATHEANCDFIIMAPPEHRQYLLGNY